MKINLATEKGLEKLQSVLDDVQKHSRVRTVSSIEIREAADNVFSEIGISKAAMAGTRAYIDVNAQNFPNAYNGLPESTIVEIEYFNGHWVAIDVYRGHTHRANHEAEIILSESAKVALLQRFSCLSV